MTPATTATVVARWTSRPATTTPVVCDGCGETLDPGTPQCPQCRQAAVPTPTGMLAVLVQTVGGDRRLVIAERTPTGGWAPTRHLPASPDVVRALARQDQSRGGAA